MLTLKIVYNVNTVCYYSSTWVLKTKGVTGDLLWYLGACYEQQAELILLEILLERENKLTTVFVWGGG